MNPNRTRFWDLWCRLMHDAPMWPSHGEYECRTCGRYFPVCWEEPLAPWEREAVAPSQRADAQGVGDRKRIEDSIFVAVALGLLELATLILSMVPCPGAGGRASP